MLRSINVITTICWLLTTVQATPIGSPSPTPMLMKAEEMLSYMNETADPCEDFYNFACGNWPNIHSSKLFHGMTTSFHLAHKDWEEKTMQILEIENEHDTDVERRVKEFYGACLVLNAGKAYNDKLKDLTDEFGGMPALSGTEWEENDFNWLNTIAAINYKYGLQIILGFIISQDPEDGSVTRVRLRHPEFNQNYFANKKSLKRYRKSVTDYLHKYLDVEETLAKQTAQEIVDFEAALAAGSTYDPFRDEQYIETPRFILQWKYLPDLDVKKYLKTSLGVLPRGKIHESFPEYQENVIELMKNTSKKVVANYIFYKLVREFRPPKFSDDKPRRYQCHSITKRFFANVLDNMTYKQSDFEAAEQDAMSIFQDLQTFYDSALASETYYPWISKKTRKRAVEKIRGMQIKLNKYDDVNFVEEYSKVTINKYDYLANLKSVHEQEAINNRALLYGPKKPYYSPHNVFSPFNVVAENTIRLPLATLQRSYFVDQDLPVAYNMGRLGFLIAHEIVHSLDDLGRRIDVNGNMNEWWDRQSIKNFNQRAECFINQTQTFTHEGKPLARRQNQGENIADSGGIRVAFEIYKMWNDNALLTQRERDMEALPGLKYRNSQLFFLSYAQMMCVDISKASLDSMILSDTHLPMHFRIIGSLSNYEDFAETFNCPTGSKMNPVQKCRIY